MRDVETGCGSVIKYRSNAMPSAFILTREEYLEPANSNIIYIIRT